MTPPIGQSVTLTSPGHWALGSVMVCEEVVGLIPADAIVNWKDGPSTFCLRSQLLPDATTQASGDSKAGKIHEGGSAAAAWTISDDVCCKVTSWVEGMELEAETVQFVKKNAPMIPVPDIIYTWVDQAWQRTFLIMRRVHGERLDKAFPKLSPDQINGVARELAGYAKALANATSPRAESSSGCGLSNEHYLLGAPEWTTWPSWKPFLHPNFTTEGMTNHLRSASGEDPPAIGDKFYFCNTGMGPSNVFVSTPSAGTDAVHVTAILDWECAGYYPHWWISTLARVSAGFYLQIDGAVSWDWNIALSDALAEEGFECEAAWFLRYMERTRKT